MSASAAMRMLLSSSSSSSSDDHSDPIVDNLEHASVGATGVDGVLFIAFSVLAGLFVQVIWEEVKFLKKYVPLPYTVVIFIIGLAWGYCSPKYENGYSLDTAMSSLVGIDPHLFLQLFIPPLLFESGWAMNIHMFKKCTWPCLWLASVGVVISMMVTALLCYYVYPDNWDWNTSLIFGAMAAATDPVAVAAVLKELGAPETLATVIEGESLLNDGSSFVFFSIFVKRAHEYQSAGDVAETLAQMALGGAAFGALMGIAASICLRLNYHRNNLFFEIMLTLTLPYLTFWVAENPFKVSGVLGVVIMALVMNHEAAMYVRHKHELHQFWEHIAFICNTVVFMISGTLVGDSYYQRNIHDVGYQLASYAYINLIRFAIVFGSLPLLSRLGYGFDWKQASVATWGGLRGAVGLAMAIMVLHDHNIEKEHREEIFDYTASLVLLTLCVNGTSTGYLLQLLDFDKKSDISVAVAKESRQKLIAQGKAYVENLETEHHSDCGKGCQVRPNVAVLQRSLDLFAEGTQEAFDSLPFLKTEHKDLDTVKEHMLLAVQNQLAFASEKGILDTAALFFVKDSCDKLLDPRYDSADYDESKLCDWWSDLLQPQADALMNNWCGCIENLPLVGPQYKLHELKRSLLGVELAIAFQTIIGRVIAQVANRKGDLVEHHGISGQKIKAGSGRQATDADGDGMISRDEWIERYGKDTVAEFEALDHDGSGSISAAEFKQASSSSMNSAVTNDAIDLIETDIIKEFESTVEDAQKWLNKQPQGLVAMVETRRGATKMLLEIHETTAKLSHTGGFAPSEADIIFESLRKLSARNDYCYSSKKFRAQHSAEEFAGTTAYENPITSGDAVNIAMDSRKFSNMNVHVNKTGANPDIIDENNPEMGKSNKDRSPKHRAGKMNADDNVQNL